MPTYRGIKVTLKSQFDIARLPEYVPRQQEDCTDLGINDKAPPHIDEKMATCSVYIPVFPGSQFWIEYAVQPPVPQDQHFVFKLFINGAHIVSWSTGKEEGWKGKTMFGLFEKDYGNGRRSLEKRILCFTSPKDEYSTEWTDVTDAFDEKAYMEFRVHRAHGRKRVEREAVEYESTEHAKDRRGIKLVNAGRAGSEQLKRFYKFALIDPIDQPFATFRYYYRTWIQIRNLGLLAGGVYPGSDDENDLSIIEPGHVDDADAGDAEAQPTVYIPRGAPRRRATARECGPPACHARASFRDNMHRLSVPSSLKFESIMYKSRPLPLLPKRDPLDGIENHTQLAFPMNQWVERMPSPIQSIRDGIYTPPLVKRKPSLASGLMNVFANAWKRGTTPTPEPAADEGGRTASQISSHSDASRNE